MHILVDMVYVYEWGSPCLEGFYWVDFALAD